MQSKRGLIHTYVIVLVVLMIGILGSVFVFWRFDWSGEQSCGDYNRSQGLRLYHNKKYDLFLWFPPRWDSVKIEQFDDTTGFSVGGISFSLPHAQSKELGTVFTYTVFTGQQWEKGKRENALAGYYPIFNGFTFPYYVGTYKLGEDEFGFEGFPPPPKNPEVAYEGPNFDIVHLILPSQTCRGRD